MIGYLIAAIIILFGWAIVRFAFDRILNSEKNLTPEHINISVCPICGSTDTTTTTENTSLGLNLKCKKCKYVGTMLEMNLVQAKRYEELKRKEELKRAEENII